MMMLYNSFHSKSSNETPYHLQPCWCANAVENVDQRHSKCIAYVMKSLQNPATSLSSDSALVGTVSSAGGCASSKTKECHDHRTSHVQVCWCDCCGVQHLSPSLGEFVQMSMESSSTQVFFEYAGRICQDGSLFAQSADLEGLLAHKDHIRHFVSYKATLLSLLLKVFAHKLP